VELAVPQTVEEISPAWIDAVLRGAGVQMAGRVAALQTTRVGVEIGFLSQSARIAMTYEGGRGDAPETLFVKLEPSPGQYRTTERPTVGARTARLVDCQAERIFAAALELDAGSALD